MEATPELVKELREYSGAGMMECKEALTYATDWENAIHLLRINGTPPGHRVWDELRRNYRRSLHKQGPLPPNPDPRGDFIRTSGSCLCSICGLDYYAHPHDWEELSYQGEPFLRVACDGTRLKL